MSAAPDYWMLADEIELLAPNTAFRLTPQAQRTIVAALRMVKRVDDMMAFLGMHGEITTRDDLASAVMQALEEVDPQ